MPFSFYKAVQRVNSVPFRYILLIWANRRPLIILFLVIGLKNQQKKPKNSAKWIWLFQNEKNFSVRSLFWRKLSIDSLSCLTFSLQTFRKKVLGISLKMLRIFTIVPTKQSTVSKSMMCRMSSVKMSRSFATCHRISWRENSTSTKWEICHDRSGLFILILFQYAMVFASAQKNFGASGLVLTIVRKDWVDKVTNKTIPIVLEYKTQIANASMYNTPPTFPSVEWSEKKRN